MQLAIIVPCYNEAQVLPTTASSLLDLLAALRHDDLIGDGSRVYFVDDGSTDATWAIIEQLVADNDQVRGIKLTRNNGHQNALLAGLFTAEGDAVVTIDADLQDDVAVIREMVTEHRRGVDVVYGVRRRRDQDSSFKRSTARGFYRLMAWMGVETVQDHADFRLLSRRAVEALKQFSEVNLFVRGIVPLIGYSSCIVRYDRAERLAGESKYPLRKMVALAWDGITSFSVFPLKLITVLGFLLFLVSVGVSVWAVVTKYVVDRAIPGWTSTVLPMYLMGGIQLLCIGILGEYLGKVYREVKRRPRYFIEKEI